MPSTDRIETAVGAERDTGLQATATILDRIARTIATKAGEAVVTTETEEIEKTLGHTQNPINRIARMIKVSHRDPQEVRLKMKWRTNLACPVADHWVDHKDQDPGETRKSLKRETHQFTKTTPTKN